MFFNNSTLAFERLQHHYVRSAHYILFAGSPTFFWCYMLNSFRGSFLFLLGCLVFFLWGGRGFLVVLSRFVVSWCVIGVVCSFDFGDV